MPDVITLTPQAAFMIVLGAVLGAGALYIWRENTWHRRVETLRAEFGRELRKRDDEILRLNTRLDTFMDVDATERRYEIDRARLREREQGISVTNVLTGGGLTTGGDIVGKDKTGSA